MHSGRARVETTDADLTKRPLCHPAPLMKCVHAHVQGSSILGLGRLVQQIHMTLWVTKQKQNPEKPSMKLGDISLNMGKEDRFYKLAFYFIKKK